MNKVTINDKIINLEGNIQSLTLKNGKVILNGKEIEIPDEKVINISVIGDIGKLELETANEVKVTGHTGDIEITNGNLRVNEYVDGYVRVINGNVNAKKIQGNCKVTNGDIKKSIF